MGRVHTRVEDRDGRRARGRGGPVDGVPPDARQRPLVGIPRVVRSAFRRASPIELHGRDACVGP